MNKGLLIEGSRTNSALFPPDNIGWRADTTSGTANGTSFDSSIIGLDGRPAAVYEWVGASGGPNSGRSISDIVAVTAGQQTVLTVYLAGYDIYTSANLGIIGSISGWGANPDTTARIVSGPGAIGQSVGGIWFVTGLSLTELTKVEIIRTATIIENMAALWYPDQSGEIFAPGAAGVIAMPQLEIGAFASSYIPTTTTAVTRNADFARVTGLTILPDYTAFAEFARPPVGSVNASERLIGWDGTAPRFAVTPLSSTGLTHTAYNNVDGNTAGAAGLNQAVRRVAGNSQTSPQLRRIVADGQSVVGDGGFTPMTSTMYVGTEGDNFNTIDTYLRDIRLYPSALSDPQLQSLTAP